MQLDVCSNAVIGSIRRDLRFIHRTGRRLVRNPRLSPSQFVNYPGDPWFRSGFKPAPHCPTRGSSELFLVDHAGQVNGTAYTMNVSTSRRSPAETGGGARQISPKSATAIALNTETCPYSSERDRMEIDYSSMIADALRWISFGSLDRLGERSLASPASQFPS